MVESRWWSGAWQVGSSLRAGWLRDARLISLFPASRARKGPRAASISLQGGAAGAQDAASQTPARLGLTSAICDACGCAGDVLAATRLPCRRSRYPRLPSTQRSTRPPALLASQRCSRASARLKNSTRRPGMTVVSLPRAPAAVPGEQAPARARSSLSRSAPHQTLSTSRRQRTTDDQAIPLALISFPPPARVSVSTCDLPLPLRVRAAARVRLRARFGRDPAGGALLLADRAPVGAASRIPVPAAACRFRRTTPGLPWLDLYFLNVAPAPRRTLKRQLAAAHVTTTSLRTNSPMPLRFFENVCCLLAPPTAAQCAPTCSGSSSERVTLTCHWRLPFSELSHKKYRTPLTRVCDVDNLETDLGAQMFAPAVHVG